MFRSCWRSCLVILPLVFVACTSTTDEEAASVPETVGSAGGRLGPLLVGPPTSVISAMSIAGTVQFNEKQGCVTLSGQVNGVIWPNGSNWDADRKAVVLPDGSQFTVGQAVTGPGKGLGVGDPEARGDLLGAIASCGWDSGSPITWLQGNLQLAD